MEHFSQVMVPPDAPSLRKKFERFAKLPGCNFLPISWINGEHFPVMIPFYRCWARHLSLIFLGDDFFFSDDTRHFTTILNSWQKVHSVFQSLWDWRCKMPMITFTSSGDESCTANDVLRCPNTWSDVHRLSPWKKNIPPVAKFCLKVKRDGTNTNR